MKAKIVYKKVRDYIHYDLKEIVWPSSLPDPPGMPKRRELTWHEHWLVLKEASRLYAASWTRNIGPELRPNDYKKAIELDDKQAGSSSTSGEAEPSLLEQLAVAARGGAETLRPALQRIYSTRVSHYKDALQYFVEAYQEGLREVLEKENTSQEHHNDAENKS